MCNVEMLGPAVRNARLDECISNIVSLGVYVV
jgi:hypothetical protein